MFFCLISFYCSLMTRLIAYMFVLSVKPFASVLIKWKSPVNFACVFLLSLVVRILCLWIVDVLRVRVCKWFWFILVIHIVSSNMHFSFVGWFLQTLVSEKHSKFICSTVKFILTFEILLLIAISNNTYNDCNTSMNVGDVECTLNLLLFVGFSQPLNLNHR